MDGEEIFESYVRNKPVLPTAHTSPSEHPPGSPRRQTGRPLGMLGVNHPILVEEKKSHVSYSTTFSAWTGVQCLCPLSPHLRIDLKLAGNGPRSCLSG
jgi:hypothetical protein